MDYVKSIIYAVLLGLLLIILGYISGFIIQKIEKTQIPKGCEKWNENHVMEKSLFLTGVMTYIVIMMFKD